MSIELAIVLAVLAFLGGAWAGYRDGLTEGRIQGIVKQRIAELVRPQTAADVPPFLSDGAANPSWPRSYRDIAAEAAAIAKRLRER